MMPPLFSIITPTYNREKLIVESLDCVKAQTYRPIELIIINDGSTDNSEEVIHQWISENAEPDSLTVVVENQVNQGQGAARNRGMELATGKYVQFLDSDDRISPDRLQVLADMFQADPELDFIQTGFDGFCAECGEVFEEHHGNPDVDQLILACRGRLWANTLRSAFTNRVLQGVRWNTEMTCFEDFEFVVQVLLQARKTAAIRDISASARRGGGIRVSDQLRSYDGRRQRIMCEAALVNGVNQRTDIPEKEKAELASRIYGLGVRSLASGWPDRAKSCEDLADSLNANLNKLGRRRRRILKLGKLACIAYGKLGTWKRRNQYSVVQPHECT